MVSRQVVESSAAQGLTIVAAAVLAFAIAISPTPALAVVDCSTAPSPTADADGDGFSDFVECNGITLPLALGGATFPRCTFAAGEDRRSCIDPNSKDVFLIVVRAPSSLLPSDLSTLLGGFSGLPVTVHFITLTAAPTSRTVLPPQNAILLSESRDTNGDTAGQCNWGTPNEAAVCVIFTQRIVNAVNNAYATCQPSPPAGTIQSIITTYFQQVAAHEPSHSMKLTKIYDSRYGGHHYKTASGTMMAQSNSFSCKGSTVIWNIGTAYTDADRGDFLLK